MGDKQAKKPQERYLKIPNHIRNIADLHCGVKELLAHIYSFGAKGCWQKNETLGKMFFRAPCTIKRWVAILKAGGHIQIKNPNGPYRTMWARTHPDVAAASRLWYRGRETPKAECGEPKPADVPGQKCPSNRGKNDQVTGAKMALRVGQECPTTNNKTDKETKREITAAPATPSPLPAGGQAPALLEDRKAGQHLSIEQFKRSFGRQRVGPPPSAEEFQRRKNEQLRALRVTAKKI